MGSVSEDLQVLLGDLHNHYRLLEMIWKQSSRVNWVQEGEYNIFFHSSTMTKIAENLIFDIETDADTTVTTRDEIAEVFEQYFKENGSSL